MLHASLYHYCILAFQIACKYRTPCMVDQPWDYMAVNYCNYNIRIPCSSPICMYGKMFLVVPPPSEKNVFGLQRLRWKCGCCLQGLCPRKSYIQSWNVIISAPIDPEIVSSLLWASGLKRCLTCKQKQRDTIQWRQCSHIYEPFQMVLLLPVKQWQLCNSSSITNTQIYVWLT